MREAAAGGAKSRAELAADKDALWQERRRLLARVAELERVLGDIVADGWAGWGADPDADLWVCFHCGAKGAEIDRDPPEHKGDCPLAVARAALAVGEGRVG